MAKQQTVSKTSNQPDWLVHGKAAMKAAIEGENKSALSRAAAIAALVEAHFEFALMDDDFRAEEYGLEKVTIPDLVVASGDRKLEAARFKAVMGHIFELYVLDAGEPVPNPIFFQRDKDSETEEVSDRKFRAVEKLLRRAIKPAVYIIQEAERQNVDFRDLMTFDGKALWLPLSFVCNSARKKEALASLSDKFTGLFKINGQKITKDLVCDLNSLDATATAELTASGQIKPRTRPDGKSAGQGKVQPVFDLQVAAETWADKLGERGFGPDARAERGAIIGKPETSVALRRLVGAYLSLWCVTDTGELDLERVYEVMTFAQDQVNQLPADEEETEPAEDVEVKAA